MKKAKIMLSAIAVVAIIGGALAFKVNVPRGSVSIATCDFSAGTCAINIVQNASAATLNPLAPNIFTAYPDATMNVNNAGLPCSNGCTTSVYMQSGL